MMDPMIDITQSQLPERPVTDLLEKLAIIADEPLINEKASEIKAEIRSHPFKNALFSCFVDYVEEEDPQLIRLDNMLIAEGVANGAGRSKNDSVSVSNVVGDKNDFNSRFEQIKSFYNQELKKYEDAEKQFNQHVVSLLNEQSTIRPILSTEIDRMVHTIRKKFINIQIQLKQLTCESFMMLKSRFMDARRKRRNFSKQSVDLLNEYFYAHLSNPYPSEEVKEELARQCNITVSQVSNWFGNKRIRYKKNIAKAQEEASLYNAKKNAVQQQMSHNPYANMLANNHMNTVNPMAAMNPMMNPYAAMMSAQNFPQLGQNLDLSNTYNTPFVTYGNNNQP
ncbi:Pre-B-cell leukemia transcription factor 4 [Strongyloides ratti]|uniref:Pre-B-cell leukemia transcription factor 4 n=1 Tax=Strongyloides ratti TaxID=34506 RepID=A0A090LFS8_STRRB|nr:Pre-B-cell leukemia transcription factor 4 [Strongyloides ratti]CEF68636.1 Pre-B-cell leukemia transcription factor 4 [Strongyloides ratti]